MVNEKTSVNQKHIENDVLGPFFVDVLKIHPEKAQQKTNATRTFWLFGLEHEKKNGKNRKLPPDSPRGNAASKSWGSWE